MCILILIDFMEQTICVFKQEHLIKIVVLERRAILLLFVSNIFQRMYPQRVFNFCFKSNNFEVLVTKIKSKSPSNLHTKSPLRRFVKAEIIKTTSTKTNGPRIRIES